jgi:transposase-like protein
MGTSLRDRRRSWPEAMKREIVAASLEAGKHPAKAAVG